MASPKEKEAVVEVEDEGIVEIDVSDNPDLAGVSAEALAKEAKTLAEVESEPKKEPKEKKPLPRVKLAEPTATSDALQKSLQTAENARKAAEATAIAERQAREAAERRVAEREQEAKSYQEEAAERELSILTNGIEGAQREIKAYEDELTRQFEAGEFAKAAATQTKLSKATATLDRLEAAKADFEAGAVRKPTPEGRVEAAATDNAPPFERYVQTFAPPAQAWLRAHPECAPANVGGNPQANAKMMAGHYAALSQNLEPNSPDYFRVIEEHTGHRAPVVPSTEDSEEDEPIATPKPAAKKTLAQPSAPPSREPPTAGGQVPRTTRQVTLTKEQQEAARMSFPNLTPQQAFATYARNLLELEAEGKMGRFTH